MRTYIVTFYKTVSDDTGHDHHVLQRQVAVRAQSDVSAEWQAKAMLCEHARVIDWRLRADTCEVAAAPHLAA
ncbi:hypothetical protein [Methylobacterium sp. NEAU K]|uniref:hypothetical protein n=1 Tax=Methylobacterium sp. NEAU K TaxID=3064946 RepID=UPI002732DA34|nr:hypothetical protein [Methylobacterium sp. NEAU K]MDP4004931.1 hypothetical protein [Methylobacterium sp. NEAU K]